MAKNSRCRLVDALNLGDLKGTDGARRAFTLHSGGGVQGSGDAIVM